LSFEVLAVFSLSLAIRRQKENTKYNTATKNAKGVLWRFWEYMVAAGLAERF
jgi:hypothetical protein